MRLTLASFLAGVILGVAIALVYVAASGGWYRYYTTLDWQQVMRLVNEGGCKPVPKQTPLFVIQCPRFRF